MHAPAGRTKERPQHRGWKTLRTLLWFLPIVLLGAWYVYEFRAPQPPDLQLGTLAPRVSEAVQQARTRVEQHPRSANAWGELGMVLLAHDLLEQAQSSFAQAEDLDPQDAAWPYYQGVCLFRSEPEQAIDAFQRSAQISDSDLPRMRVIELLLESQRIDEADELIQVLTQRLPNHPYLNLARARVLDHRSRYEQAVEHAQACLASNSNIRSAHTLLARLYYRLAKTERAREHAESSQTLPLTDGLPDKYIDELTNHTFSVDGFIDIAESHEMLNRHELAIKALQNGLRRCGPHDRLYIALGQLQRDANDYTAARASHRKATELNPRNAIAHRELGRTLTKVGRYDEAADSLQKAVQLEPGDSLSQFELGRCLINLKRFDEALRPCHRAVRQRPNDASAYGNLAIVFLNLGEFEKAIEQLRAMLELNPQDAQARDMLHKAQRIQAKKSSQSPTSN